MIHKCPPSLLFASTHTYLCNIIYYTQGVYKTETSAEINIGIETFHLFEIENEDSSITKIHVQFSSSNKIMSKQILSPSKTFSKWSESIIGFELSLNGSFLFFGWGEEFHWIFIRPLIHSCAFAKIFSSLFVTVLFF